MVINVRVIVIAAHSVRLWHRFHPFPTSGGPGNRAAPLLWPWGIQVSVDFKNKGLGGGCVSVNGPFMGSIVPRT